MGNQKQITDFTVQRNIGLGGDFVQLHLHSDCELPAIFPGQFVQVHVPSSIHGWLRIPISIHDADPASGQLKLLVQKVGKGSEYLASRREGEKVNLVLPLGKGFFIPEIDLKKEVLETHRAPYRALLVGGGCGLAPLYYLASKLKEKGFPFDILVGARNKERLVLANELAQLGPTGICTEDGSVGIKGLVTEHPLWKGVDYTHVYTCGPTPMMRAVAAKAHEMKAVCEVSLENTMACGLGACLCCVTASAEGHHLCVCTEGPVFKADTLGW
ncbi:MAG: dihydroorotate dehydrogenase electron transfer subunit [Bacteroidales bacterium]|nr:dihydroorotate dehydrogenase electron transfer subunit [Bacteroidales bacterium]MDE7072181.1 dihydroorotate dehydrogenase electron transfer subunit [Bacteroidales bacterium]